MNKKQKIEILKKIQAGVDPADVILPDLSKLPVYHFTGGSNTVKEMKTGELLTIAQYEARKPPDKHIITFQ